MQGDMYRYSEGLGNHGCNWYHYYIPGVMSRLAQRALSRDHVITNSVGRCGACASRGRRLEGMGWLLSFRGLSVKEQQDRVLADDPSVNYNAGAELLHSYQTEWSQLHRQAEENARDAQVRVCALHLFITKCLSNFAPSSSTIIYMDKSYCHWCKETRAYSVRRWHIKSDYSLGLTTRPLHAASSKTFLEDATLKLPAATLKTLSLLADINQRHLKTSPGLPPELVIDCRKGTPGVRMETLTVEDIYSKRQTEILPTGRSLTAPKALVNLNPLRDKTKPCTQFDSQLTKAGGELTVLRPDWPLEGYSPRVQLSLSCPSLKRLDVGNGGLDLPESTTSIITAEVQPFSSPCPASSYVQTHMLNKYGNWKDCSCLRPASENPPPSLAARDYALHPAPCPLPVLLSCMADTPACQDDLTAQTNEPDGSSSCCWPEHSRQFWYPLISADCLYKACNLWLVWPRTYIEGSQGPGKCGIPVQDEQIAYYSGAPCAVDGGCTDWRAAPELGEAVEGCWQHELVPRGRTTDTQQRPVAHGTVSLPLFSNITIGTLQELCEDVESALINLEDVIETQELQEKQLEHRFPICTLQGIIHRGLIGCRAGMKLVMDCSRCVRGTTLVGIAVLDGAKSAVTPADLLFTRATQTGVGFTKRGELSLCGQLKEALSKLGLECWRPSSSCWLEVVVRALPRTAEVKEGVLHVSCGGSYCIVVTVYCGVASVKLAQDHSEKVVQHELRQQQLLKERQEIFEEAFNQDVQEFKSSGAVPRKVSLFDVAHLQPCCGNADNAHVPLLCSSGQDLDGPVGDVDAGAKEAGNVNSEVVDTTSEEVDGTVVATISSGVPKDIAVPISLTGHVGLRLGTKFSTVGLAIGWWITALVRLFPTVGFENGGNRLAGGVWDTWLTYGIFGRRWCRWYLLAVTGGADNLL
ncbi:hypothetical protein PR048_030922 [Dryococelus australis]|uniref:Uncharacterized protein n=1 Tax=Dryococelus australis TaxID=614101 RepID=A0ABQ9GA93_9NEOP|nr:hypothetical protein PR048_030922 [Dryococelus australis]